MESSFIDTLVVPQDLDWPVVGRTRDGRLLVRREAIGRIEELNGLPPGTLDSGSIVRLLTLWYRERRKLGFPRQAEFEQLEGGSSQVA